MSSQGFTAEIHKVANNGKQLALFLSLSLMCAWVVVLNGSINEITPRWFQREFSWIADESIPPIFTALAAGSILITGLLWLFSGNGSRLFSVDAEGIVVRGYFSSKTYHWRDFEFLEREVSSIILHLTPEAQHGFGRSKIRFDLSGIDCPGSKLEALIVYYRPDLFRTLQAAKPMRNGQDDSAQPSASKPGPAPEAVAAEPPQSVNLLSQRIARLR
jgi:hypothetical protein